MGQVVFVAPLAVLFVVGFWLFGAKRMLADRAKYGKPLPLGELAQRMGLQVLEGDPAAPLTDAEASQNKPGGQKTGGAVGRFLGDRVWETRIRLQGAPYGRPTEFYLFDRHQVDERVVAKVHYIAFECRLTVHIPVRVPPFEIVNRKRVMGMKVETQMDLPRSAFGDDGLDSELVLHTSDRRIGPVLAPAVAPLTDVRIVHVQGYETVVQALFEAYALVFTATDLVPTQQALEHMATVLAGPVPQHR